MATGKKIQVKIPIAPIVTHRDETHVQLVLTQDEANFLQDVMGSIGGDPKTSRRKYQARISEALYEAEVGSFSLADDKHGSIYFGADPTGDYIKRLRAQIIELGGELVY